MNKIIEQLLLLQNLELGESNETPESQALRKQIPAKELLTYDKLRRRGKKGVALARNGVCSACHIRMPIGKIASLMMGTTVMTCDHCGSFLYLSQEQASLFENRKAVMA